MVTTLLYTLGVPVLAFFAPLFAAFVTVVAAVIPPITVPGTSSDKQPPFPAPPGYLLPWSGGKIHTVTQGEETAFTHNLLAAYAFDFDMGYDTVVASRAGKVSMIREDSNLGGCSAIYAGSANYVVIDHGDGTSALYLHLAQASVVVEPGDLVHQGDPIGISGETGVTCSGDGIAPGAHLHFQVQRTVPNHYFSQSVPIAFDDISTNKGVPVEGRSYISGNYGHGKPQKIKLTPHRVPRPFNPVALPTDPTLVEGEHVPVPPKPEPSPSKQDGQNRSEPSRQEQSSPSETSSPEPTRTPRPTRTPSPEPTDTALPQPTNTPVPAPTDTPAPPPTAAPPPPEPTLVPATDTPVATMSAELLTPSVTDTAPPTATLAAEASPTPETETPTPGADSPTETTSTTTSATPP